MSEATSQIQNDPKRPQEGSTLNQQELKAKANALKDEFLETFKNIKPAELKTTQSAENASEYLYDKLALIESQFTNKVNPADNWREYELIKLKKALTDGRAEIIQAFENDFKSSAESVLAFEIDQVIDEIDHTLCNYKYWLREGVDVPLIYKDGNAYLHNDPYGVVLIISDWLSPLVSLLKPAVGAIAAGNHVILAPDPTSKKISETLKIVLSRFLDERRVQVIPSNDINILLDLPINFIYATGSEEKLKSISKVASEKSIPTAFNRQSLNIGIIHESADLNLASEKIVLSRFINSGQFSTSPDYIYVQNSVFTDFFVKCKIHIFCNYKNPGKNKDYSRMVSTNYAKKILDLIDHHEGKLETKVHFDNEERLLEPVIITDPSDQSVLVKDPLRGPILVLRKYSDLPQIIDEISSQSNINNIYFFSKNLQSKNEISTKIRNCNIIINEAGIQNFNFHLPYGSVGSIYNVKIGGIYGFKTFSTSRIVFETNGLRQFKNILPPLTAEKYRKFHSFDVLKRGTLRQIRFLSIGIGALVGYLMFRKKQQHI